MKTRRRNVQAVVIKDHMGLYLAPVDPKDKQVKPGNRSHRKALCFESLLRVAGRPLQVGEDFGDCRQRMSRMEATFCRGVAGAVLTNPLDVVRNEMFKTEEGMIPCMVRMSKEAG